MAMASKTINAQLIDRIKQVGETVASGGDIDCPEEDKKVIKTSEHQSGKTTSMIFFQTADLQTLITVRITFRGDELKAILEIYPGGSNPNEKEGQLFKSEYLYNAGKELEEFLHQLEMFLNREVTKMGSAMIAD